MGDDDIGKFHKTIIFESTKHGSNQRKGLERLRATQTKVQVVNERADISTNLTYVSLIAVCFYINFWSNSLQFSCTPL